LKRDLPDYFWIKPEHREVHDALLNWARVVRDNANGPRCAPIFRHYRAVEEWFEPGAAHEKPAPIRPLEGWRMEQSVSKLPEKERAAVRWHYVYTRVQPWRMARKLAVHQTALLDLVHRGRAMLTNRGRLA
jgi:hypothetical protein